MPTLEFECPQGHVTERFFKSISEGEKVEEIDCPSCDWHYEVFAVDDVEWTEMPVRPQAKKIISRPLGFGLYGDPAGYDRPSATKRYNTKTVSQKEGNANSVG